MLNSKQRAALRGAANALDPVYQVGKGEIDQTLIQGVADCLAARDFNGAARLLSELLASDAEPIAALAAIGGNMRRLYAARVAIDEGLGREFVEKLYNIRYSRITDELMSAARRLTRAYLARAVELCAETDYRMKSSPAGDRELLAELLIRLSAA